MVKLFSILLACSALLGCSTVPKAEKQEVPVYSCPEINIEPLPTLYTKTLNKNSPPEDVEAFYKADIVNLLNYIERLTAQINSLNEK